jgi:hypothetical protein
MSPRAPGEHEQGQGLEWAHARHARQMREARLPKALRSVLRGIRDDSLRNQVLDFVDDEVLIRLGKRPMIVVPSEVETPESKAEDHFIRNMYREADGCLGTGEIAWVPRGPNGHIRRPEIHPGEYFEAVDRLAADETFLQRLRRKSRDTLRYAHVQGVAPEVLLGATGCVPDVKPENGHLVVPSDIGLGTATYLEGAPEGWHAWAVHEIGRRVPAVALEDGEYGCVGLGLDTLCPTAVPVLDLHAGPGGFARAVAARGEPLPVIKVYETDPWYDTATSLPCVVSRNPCDLEVQFAFIVSAIPSAARPEAGGQQRIYGGFGCRRGAPGPKRWLRELRGLLGCLSTLLLPGGAVLLLLPLGVRVGRGYVEDDQLRQGVEDIVRAVPGLQLDARYETEEDEPVARPFVGKRRPLLLTVVLTKCEVGS